MGPNSKLKLKSWEPEWRQVETELDASGCKVDANRMQSGYLKWRRTGGCSNWPQILNNGGYKADIESGGKWRLGWRKVENKVEIEAKTREDPGGPKWTIKRKLSGLFFVALRRRQRETRAD